MFLVFGYVSMCVCIRYVSVQYAFFVGAKYHVQVNSQSKHCRYLAGEEISVATVRVCVCVRARADAVRHCSTSNNHDPHEDSGS